MSVAEKSKRPAGRKLAEWVTLGASVVVVLAVAGYLLKEALKEHPPFVPVALSLRVEDARESDGRFVVPLVVSNRGERSIRELKILVTTRAGSNPAEPSEVTVDFLGERASETVYLVFERHPGELRAEARAKSYQLD